MNHPTTHICTRLDTESGGPCLPLEIRCQACGLRLKLCSQFGRAVELPAPWMNAAGFGWLPVCGEACYEAVLNEPTNGERWSQPPAVFRFSCEECGAVGRAEIRDGKPATLPAGWQDAARYTWRPVCQQCNVVGRPFLQHVSMIGTEVSCDDE